jgi:hypothetical protein
MRLPQQHTEAIRNQLIEVIGIGALVLFGVIMVFLGWLKYKDRNKPAKTKPRQRSKPKTRKK